MSDTIKEKDRQLLIEFAKYAKKYDGITKFATAEHLVDGFIERNPHLFSQSEVGFQQWVGDNGFAYVGEGLFANIYFDEDRQIEVHDIKSATELYHIFKSK